MQTKLSPLEVLILWGLLGNGGAQWLNEIKPKLQPKSRENLQKAGLIVVEKKKNEKNRGATWIEVTDKGWAWAAENLDAKVSDRSPAAGPILEAWLKRLKAYMQRSHVPLAEIMATPRAPFPRLPERVTEAYLAISGGSWAKRVRLSQLRDRLADIQRQDLDDTILGMQGQSKLVLYALDNPSEITTQDQHAAILIGREPRHILYMPRS
ncbi:MAG: hypothetical protein ACLP7P_02190 [Rhodomicrobium sp.]